MTPDQRQRLRKLGEEIIRLFPDTYGSVTVRFNLQPGRKDVNMNIAVEESYRLQQETNRS